MSSPKFQQQVYKPSSITLQRLNDLERPSPKFPDQLTNLLTKIEYEYPLLFENLCDEDRAWFVEYLENVLDDLEYDSPAYQKCRGELQEICGHWERLPRSHLFDVSSLVPAAGSTPIGGPYQITCEGLLNGSKVCAKMLHPSHLSYEESLTKPMIEAIVKWKHLIHPNVVPFLGVTDKPIHFVSAWTPGVQLNKYITLHPGTSRLELLIGIASGLDFLHSNDVVHGDLGGPHIIVDDSGRPRIAEYGIDNTFSWSKKAQIYRCLRWIHPSGSMPSQKEDDVFSFAMVVVEVFTGEVPFFLKSDSEAWSAMERGERPERPTHTELTDKLWALMGQCWDEDYEGRPEISEVLGVLRDHRGKGTGQERGGVTQESGSDQPRTQAPNPNGKGSPNNGGSGQSIKHGPGKEDVGGAPLVSPPAPTGWISEITNKILCLTDQVASVALFGPIGVGKSFVARTILECDRTKAKFGENRYFLCCDDTVNSLDGFLERVSDAVHTTPTQLESCLRSSPPLILVLDGVDRVLDPLIPEAGEICATIEEFSRFGHICLVTTSRMYPDIHGYHRVEVPTPPEGHARDVFYNLSNLARSPAVDTLVTKLDFHLFSIELIARTIRENSWDEETLMKAWEDRTSLLRTGYYQRLKDAIEPAFRSPKIKELGALARDVLGMIASFRSGVEEHKLEGILQGTGGITEVVDLFCGFSLVHRKDGVLTMLSPLKFYFLESMVEYAETAEVTRWGLDCMSASGVLPVFTRGPPDCLLSPTTSCSSIHQDSDGWSLRSCSSVPTHELPSNGLPQATPHLPATQRRNWIRGLPQAAKRRAIALFGRRIAPAILSDIQEDPVIISFSDLQDDLPDVSPTAVQEDYANISPAIAQEDFEDIPPTAPQQRIPSALVPYEVDETDSDSSSYVSCDST